MHEQADARYSGGNGDGPAPSMLMFVSLEIFKPFMMPTLATLKPGGAGGR
jgi:hypothetical protein